MNFLAFKIYNCGFINILTHRKYPLIYSIYIISHIYSRTIWLKEKSCSSSWKHCLTSEPCEEGSCCLFQRIRWTVPALWNPASVIHGESIWRRLSNRQFLNSVSFISHVCSHFPKETVKFPSDLSNILQAQHNQLPPDVREKLIQNLVLLRNKDVITPEALINTLFPILVKTNSKYTRAQIYSSIISLLKTLNHNAKNQKLNKMMQALLFNLLEESEANGLWATKLTRELWRRGVWDDARTVELMVQASLNENIKVAISAVRFFWAPTRNVKKPLNQNQTTKKSLIWMLWNIKCKSTKVRSSWQEVRSCYQASQEEGQY